MSCCNYYGTANCHCSTVFAETSCGDPGLETTAKHVAVLDNQFCERRLSNPTNSLGGFLWYGTNAWRASNDPQVLLGDYPVSTNELFSSLVINTSTGAWRRVVPEAGVDGIVRADGNGNFYIQDAADLTSTVPDPLTLTTINGSNVNATNLTVSGLSTFTGVNSDTVVSFLGLNGANQLVKGSVQTASVAIFYESNTTTSPATPNFTYPSSASANVQIGNEIIDPDGIAHVVSQEVVQVDVAGTYIIEWYGQYTGYSINGNTSAGTPYNPGLQLSINNIIMSKGNVQVYQDRNIGGLAYGKYATALGVGAAIRIRGNGSMRSNAEAGGTGLQGVTLILTKFA